MCSRRVSVISAASAYRSAARGEPLKVDCISAWKIKRRWRIIVERCPSSARLIALDKHRARLLPVYLSVMFSFWSAFSSLSRQTACFSKIYYLYHRMRHAVVAVLYISGQNLRLAAMCRSDSLLHHSAWSKSYGEEDILRNDMSMPTKRRRILRDSLSPSLSLWRDIRSVSFLIYFLSKNNREVNFSCDTKQSDSSHLA